MKSADKISYVSISFLKRYVNNNICGVSAIKVAKMNLLMLSLKKIPEKFLMIKGTPGISLKIINRKKELLVISNLINNFSKDFLNFLAVIYEKVDAMVNDSIEIKPPR